MTTPIRRAEVIPYSLPFADPYVTARGRIARREMVLLRLTDDEGTTGLGEAVPLALRGGATVVEVAAALEKWSRRILDRGTLDWTTGAPPDERDTGVIAGLPAPARCAVLTALADLEARRLEIPLWRLLGAETATPVPCNATLVSGSPGSVAADARDWAAEGFTTFKLKLGLAPDRLERGQADPDLAQIAAVRSAVGPEARIRVDANGAWSIGRALDVLRRAKRYELELAEQPVATLRDMTELLGRLAEDAPPIAADESVSSPEEAAEAIELGACELATVKLSKIGQIDPSLGGELPLYLSSALDGPVGIAAAAHAYQALDPSERAKPRGDGSHDTPPLAQGLATQRLFAKTIASRECELNDGFLHLPEGHGLGVEIDPGSLALHRVATCSAAVEPGR